MSGEQKNSPSPARKKAQRGSRISGLSRITSSLFDQEKDGQSAAAASSKKQSKRGRDGDDGESLEDLFTDCFTTQKEITFKINGKTLIIKGQKIIELDRRVFEQILVAQTKEQWRAGAGGTKQIHTVVDGDLTQKEIDDIKRAAQRSVKKSTIILKRKFYFLG